MRLPHWVRIRSFRRTSPGTVTVTLVADTSQFLDAMDRVQADFEESASRRRHRRRIAAERAKGLAYVDELLDAWCAEVRFHRNAA